MAINRKNESSLEGLILHGAEEIRSLYPSFFEPQGALSDEECTELDQLDEELKRLWNSSEGQRAQQLGYSAADAVAEDRGEA